MRRAVRRDAVSRLMSTGIVKWFNQAKGYGFIQPDLQAAWSFAAGAGSRPAGESPRRQFGAVMSAQQANTMADIRRVIAEVIQMESNQALAADAADRCASSVLARLKESGVKLVKRRAA